MYIHPTNSYWQTKENMNDQLDSLYDSMYHEIMDETKTYPKRLEWLLQHTDGEDDINLVLQDKDLFIQYVDEYIQQHIRGLG